MWKKPELDEGLPATKPTRPEPRIATPPPREGATIGPSISIRGEVSGDEDLVIRGRVEGTVDLKQHNVTVGKDGQVNADVRARVVEIEGRVEGDVHGAEQVIVRSGGDVKGNLNAPRVSLEGGCRFKGCIDMGTPVESAPPKTSPKMAGIAEAPRRQSSKETSPTPKKQAS